MLAANGCSYSQNHYPPTDAFLKGVSVRVPSEFRRGVASRSDVDRWSGSLLGDPPLEFCRVDIDGTGDSELLVSQPTLQGTGGNCHLVFREGRRGFFYLGRLSFGALRPIAPDAEGRARVLTSGWMGGGECLVTLQVLESDGFHTVASRVLPCGDLAPDGAGGRLHRLLFESGTPSSEVLTTAFGARL